MVLHFPIPKRTATPTSTSGVTASTAYLNYGSLYYRIASGTDVIKGVVDFNFSGANFGNISVPLPHNGTWLVSAEWVDYYNGPSFVGADLVNVAGSTNFNLQLGNIYYYGCAYQDLGDANSCTNGYYGDLFTFDSGTIGFTGQGGTGGDIQVLYDVTTPTEYLAAASGSKAKFAYLGTGDFVDFTDIPSGAKYFADTQKAKAAAGLASSAMASNDVYVVELSSTSHVWIQVNYVNYCGSGGYLAIRFRVNTQGYPYMKFQQTTFGLANCVNLYYYGGGGG